MLSSPMNLALLQRLEPLSKPWACSLTHLICSTLFTIKNVRLTTHLDHPLPPKPLILAVNALHKYDPIPFRIALHRLGLRACTVSKGKNWHDPLSAWACDQLGALPLLSRGYLLVMDFRHVHHRPPSEPEYRALRAYLDDALPLPPDPPLQALLSTPRPILGTPFDPARASLRDHLRDTYLLFQSHLLRHARRALDHGHHIHIYPQGTASTRLSQGRIGAVQLAHALQCPILPVGLSGALDIFPRLGSLSLHPGHVHLHFGQAFTPDLSDLPPDFVPFHPDHERAHRPALARATRDLMARINALLPPEHQSADLDAPSDGASGTARFV